MTRFTFEARTRILAGPGRVNEIGAPARALGRRALLVTEPPLVAAGHAGAVERALRNAGLDVQTYAEGHPNPDSALAEEVRAFAEPLGVDLIIGLGGGSAMDLAKAANFLLTNGGGMRDYQGYGRNARELLPAILVPTSTGTGSEAQSYCVIADAETRQKMACGTASGAAKVVILDAELTLSQPKNVRSAAGFDAISHAVESWVSTKRNDLSALFSREAWRLLSGNLERVLTHLDDMEALAAMQWGAYLAGSAIEHSMLGAAHACANPLTQSYGTTHAHALSALLPHVIRFNLEVVEALYREFDADLAARIEAIAEMAELPRTLRELGVNEADLPDLARRAAEQWTGNHNPRPFDAQSALEVYRCAL